MKKGKSFTYLGLVFTGLRNLASGQAEAIFKTVHSIGISNYSDRASSSISVFYSYNKFYAAAKQAGAYDFDVFMCCGAQVVPCTNELFAIDKEQALLFKSGCAKLLKTGKVGQEKIEKEFSLFKDVKVITWKRQRHKIKANSEQEAVQKLSLLDPLDYEGREEYLKEFEEYTSLGDVEHGPVMEILDTDSECLLRTIDVRYFAQKD
jgi:hypothetical protein